MMKLLITVLMAYSLTLSINLKCQSPILTSNAGLLTKSCIGESILSGHVLNAQGRALTGVSVQIESSTYEVQTDIEGFFKLTTAISYPLNLKISGNGLKDYSIKLIEPRQDLKLRIEAGE